MHSHLYAKEGGRGFETGKRTDTCLTRTEERETFDPKIATCDDFIAGKILEKSARSGAKQSEERRFKKKFIETTTTRWARTKSAPCSRSRRPCSRWQRWKTFFFYVFCECFVWGKSEDSYLLLLFFPRALDGCNIYIIYNNFKTTLRQVITLLFYIVWSY